MRDDVFRGMFHALVKRAGGVEAVAAVIEAGGGRTTKGTVSKMCRGQIAVTLDAVVAVEDFVGAYPLTKRMVGRIDPASAPGQSLAELAATCAIAAGQAHGALVLALSEASEGGSTVTPSERTEVLARAHEAREALDRIIAVAEQGEEPARPRVAKGKA